jgi:hypothetical protein
VARFTDVAGGWPDGNRAQMSPAGAAGARNPDNLPEA